MKVSEILQGLRAGRVGGVGHCTTACRRDVMKCILTGRFRSRGAAHSLRYDVEVVQTVFAVVTARVAGAPVLLDDTDAARAVWTSAGETLERASRAELGVSQRVQPRIIIIITQTRHVSFTAAHAALFLCSRGSRGSRRGCRGRR